MLERVEMLERSSGVMCSKLFVDPALIYPFICDEIKIYIY